MAVRELLKCSFELMVKKRWLREIDKAIDQYHKTQKTANRKYIVMKALVDRYNEIYNENLWRKEDG